MRFVVTAVFFLAFSGSLGAQTAYSFTGTGTGPIQDGTATTPPAYGAATTVSFAVSGLPLNVKNVGLSFNMSHTWVGDLEVVLRAPGGSPGVFIFSRVGATTATGFGDDSDLGGTYSFGDVSSGADFWAAAATASGAAVIPAGTYRASTPGGAPGGGAIGSIDPLFAGLTPAQANGTWTLSFRDASLGQTGTVTSAAIVIFVGPTIAGLTPPTGGTAGGTAIIISGSNFDPAGTSVTVGGVAAAGLVTQTQIQISSPPHAAGTVDVVVTTAYGSSVLAGGFTYTSSSSGSSDGGDNGGGCSTATASSPLLPVLALAVLLGFALRKRRFGAAGR